MTTENNNLGIIPIFYLFLSGSTSRDPEYYQGQQLDNDEDILNTTLVENGWMNRDLREEKI